MGRYHVIVLTMFKNKKKISYPIQLTGIIKRHPDGFGFFIPQDNEHPDAYVPASHMKGAMTQDTVTAIIEKDSFKDRYWGKIESIEKRFWTQIVAPIEIKNPKHKNSNQKVSNSSLSSTARIRDAEGAWGQNILINDLSDQSLQNQDLVVVQITHYPDSPQGLRGKVIKKLGTLKESQHDVERVARGHNLTLEFSEAALKEAKKFNTQVNVKEELKNRKDLRKFNFITIDGATAKDFDDAIFVQKKSSGFTLYVAIADVSHYVSKGSSIDKDAYERGTSTYFPHYVIPMLPEVLSNDLCSLRPQVPRLAFVCQMEISNSGEINSYQFYEALIESKARVTYGQAQEIIENKEIKDLNQIVTDIKQAQKLAEILLKKRLKEGSLDLEIPEVQVIVDTQGEPLDIIKTHRLFSHRMIEELMLVTNIATARFFESHKVPGFYRVHEVPKADAIEKLSQFAKNFGVRFSPDSPQLQMELRNAIESLKGTPQAEIFSNLVLRSLKQAKYSPENIGHFGLAFTHYSHFTSPIRRYPDLIAHRIIKACLKKDKKLIPSYEDGLQWATWLSACEQRSVKAERAVTGIKKARFIEKYLGQEFDGVVSSVTRFGVFVLLRQFEVEGLVHLDNLSEGTYSKWEFNEERLTLFEKRSGKSYSLGDSIKIQVSSTNIMDGKIDFLLAPSSNPTSKTDFKNKNHKSASKSQDKKKNKNQRDKKYSNPHKKESSFKKNKKRPSLTSEGNNQSRKKETPIASSQQKSQNQNFDPGKKLIEALQKKGLNPSGRFLQQEVGQSSSTPFSKQNNKRPAFKKGRK